MSGGLKLRDHYQQVWSNLALYRDYRANVMAKYIVQENNCSRRDIEGFVRDACEAKVTCLLWDIDLRFPDPPAAIISALAFLHHLAQLNRMSLAPANIGLKSANRDELLGKIENACRALNETETESGAGFQIAEVDGKINECAAAALVP
jgi:hypothetical protein